VQIVIGTRLGCSRSHLRHLYRRLQWYASLGYEQVFYGWILITKTLMTRGIARGGLEKESRQSSPHHPGWQVPRPSTFNNDLMEVRHAVYNFDAWGVFIKNINVTALLEEAVAIGNTYHMTLEVWHRPHMRRQERRRL